MTEEEQENYYKRTENMEETQQSLNYELDEYLPEIIVKQSAH